MAAKKEEKSTSSGQVAVNRKARFDYFIEERFEAGICLQGCEVKSIREGKVSIADSYVRIMKEEAWLINCHIAAYSHLQGYTDYDTRASRKLLLHQKEILRLIGLTSQKGYAIIPLSMYFKRGRLKVEIGIGKGKKHYDKRDTIKKRIHAKESAAAIKKYSR